MDEKCYKWSRDAEANDRRDTCFFAARAVDTTDHGVTYVRGTIAILTWLYLTCCCNSLFLFSVPFHVGAFFFFLWWLWLNGKKKGSVGEAPRCCFNLPSWCFIGCAPWWVMRTGAFIVFCPSEESPQTSTPLFHKHVFQGLAG